MGDTPQNPPSAYESLEPLYRAFVDEYLACGLNASEACRRLHYKKPYQQASTFLKMGSIRAAIEERLISKKLSADDTLARISEKCTADMAYFINVSKDGSGTLDLAKARRNGKLHLIKKIKFGKGGKVETLELHDPKAYLELLARYHRLLQDQEEVPDGATIELEWEDAQPQSSQEEDAEDQGA